MRVTRSAPAALLAALLLALGAPACFDGGASKNAAGVVTEEDGPYGPTVVFDPLALPVPEIPFPNDLVLVARDDNAAGFAWNISTEASTAHERELRGRLDTLDGFGTFAPITVAFTGPIALDTVTPESVVLIDISDDEHEGERADIDLDDGFYPLDAVGSFWPFDEAADLPDFLLPADNDAFYRGSDHRVTFYEVETNTLILRPLVPLREGARYAVLVTRGVKGRGADGELYPVRSPFLYKAHAAEVDDVARGVELAGLDTADLAFGWTFTTADQTRALRELRAGLYGEGPLRRLASEFPPTLGMPRDTGIAHDANGVDYPADPKDNRFILQGEYLASVLGVVLDLAGGVKASFQYVDYVVFGSFPSVDIRTGPGRTVGINADTGEGEVGEGEVPYLIAIPRETERYKPPFPVVVYFHGTSSSRFEFLALADNLARQGIATVAFDQVGHGPIIPDIRLLLARNDLDPSLAQVLLPLLASYLAPDRTDEFEGLTIEEGLDKLSDIGFFAELALIGRTEDANGDGALESAESFFFADPFKQCAAFQQDLVDFMQLVRTLSGYRQADVPPAVADPAHATPEQLRPNLLAGDFNADGVLDIGGPDATFGVAGTSLGGIHSVMAGAIEPKVSTITPIVAGGGLSDILLRSGLRQITRVIFLEVFGPLVVGCPDGAGGLVLSLNDDSDKCRDVGPLDGLAHLDGVGAGARVRVENKDNGEVSEKVIAEDGDGVSLPVAADRWDELEVTVTTPDGRERVVLITSPYKGLGLERNTPRLRRLLGINQHVLDRCDPVNFARHLFIDPLPGNGPKSVLFANALQDRTVPVSTGVTLVRAAGVLGVDRATWQPVMDTLIASGMMVGSDYDVDDLLRDNPPEAAGIGPLPVVPSGEGVSAVRFAAVGGKHEFIGGGGGGIELDDPTTYTRNQLALFHRTHGKVVVDDLCIESDDCPLIDDPDALIQAR
ncbi:MAG: hypothetical protein KC635_11310 [Myxococcales bacterium]|nr:hypothetical protein [Myxococcales bacterium]